MKNLVYLISFVILTLSWGCEKNEVPEEQEIIDPNAITPEMLYGDWTFVSLEFKGETYYECDVILQRNYLLTTLNFKNNDEYYFYPYSDCFGHAQNWSTRWDYVIKEDIIYLANRSYNFEILSTKDEILDGVLRMKLIYAITENIPLHGIYTLQQ